jgi:hypothetical protein
MPDFMYDLPSTAAPSSVPAWVPQLRAYLGNLPDVRLGYLSLAQERTRVCLAFSRAVSSAHVERRVATCQRHFVGAGHTPATFVDLDLLPYREACEVSLNARIVYGSPEAIERDRLQRYTLFLEWNASRRVHGEPLEVPPVFRPTVESLARATTPARFVTPIYRHLKLMAGHLRELGRLSRLSQTEFAADAELRTQAETLILKAMQSTILITLSLLHRNLRLEARDFRELFARLPAYGVLEPERAERLAICADIRDRLIFYCQSVSAAELFGYLTVVSTTLGDYQAFVLTWIFEHYYGASGELLADE